LPTDFTDGNILSLFTDENIPSEFTDGITVEKIIKTKQENDDVPFLPTKLPTK